MTDRRISKRLKGKVMSTYVTPAWLYGTETLALTEIQQTLHLSKNIWVRNKARVEGRQEKNGGVNGRDGSAEELVRVPGDEQAIVGRTRRNDGGRQTTEESS